MLINSWKLLRGIAIATEGLLQERPFAYWQKDKKTCEWPGSSYGIKMFATIGVGHKTLPWLRPHEIQGRAHTMQGGQ